MASLREPDHADRWVTVGTEGISIEVPLTHSLLADLAEKYRSSGSSRVWEEFGGEESSAAMQRIIDRFESFGVFAVAFFGLLDGLNPCAFATIIFFVSYLTLSGRQGKEVLAVGAAFTLGVFVAYLSALCRNPLHTATQYALLTALAAVGRTYLSASAGFVAEATGWPLFFMICMLAALPSLILLAWLQRRGHFAALQA